MRARVLYSIELMNPVAPIVYEEVLVSPWYAKLRMRWLSFLSTCLFLLLSSAFFFTLLEDEDRWVLFFIGLFFVLCVLHLVVLVKQILASGKIIVTSEGLTLLHGKQEVSFPKVNIVQYERKRLYPGSRYAPAHVLRKEGDVINGFIACQVFPLIFPDKMSLFKSEAVFLVTKRFTSSRGGLFGRRILAGLPFFIPTNHPDRLLSALETIVPLREGGSRA